MFSPLHIARKYLRYYLVASNGRGHGMHSPFVFDFVTQVMNDKTIYPAYQQVEALRKRLLKNQALLEIQDYGAGSVKKAASQRRVASIARNAAKPPKFAQLLYRIVKYYQPASIIELGTSLGISTAYLSLGNPAARVVSIEGAPAIAQLAQQHFQEMGLKNIEAREGNFDEVLAAAISGLPVIDLAFIDGNHRKLPTLGYFEEILTKTGNESILIFDDIHWSREMEEAWALIRQDQRVRCTIDLFFIGIVFFRREFREKQHFQIRF